MRTCAYSLLLLATLVVADAPSSTTLESPTALHQTPSSTYQAPVTCESRSINYITHILPQQCLNTAAWTGASWHAAPSESIGSEKTDTAEHMSTAVPSPADTSSQTTVAEQDSSDQAASNASPSDPSTSTPATSSPTTVDDADSALDNAHFLSFEDWRKQTLEKVGQDSERLGSKRGAGAATGEPRRRPGSNSALEGLGDEAEIEIDFGGFRATGQAPKGVQQQQQQQQQRMDQEQIPTAPLSEDGADMLRMRSKDAGKTCKERFNYASFDCAANVLKTNGKVKHASSILVENKDSYMTSECSVDNKFVIVELCDDVLIDTVVLANYEFFASSFHTFRVSVSSTYPVKLEKWIVLGTFEARNTREIQAFLIENGQIFARYMRIEFLTHYGNQYYCPLSLLRVHGMTMFDHYKLWRQYQQGEIDADGEAEEEDQEVNSVAVESIEHDGKISAENAKRLQPVSSAVGSSEEPEVALHLTSHIQTTAVAMTNQDNGYATGSSESLCTRPHSTAAVAVITSQDQRCFTSSDSATPSTMRGEEAVTPRPERVHVTSPVPQMSEPPSSSVSYSSSTAPNNASSSSTKLTTSSTRQPPSQEASKDSKNQTFTATQVHASANAAPPPQAPATQESFFKSIHKRLQALETNSTLSMQYIESQSQILREAFSKVDKRNIAKTSEFLEKLNTTVLAELSRFKSDYEQLWQSTVLELASQRDEGRRERELLGEQVKLLADEVVSQKRLQAAQATLLLLCLGFVVFARVGASGVGDTAFMQNVQGFVSKRRKRHVQSDSFSSRRWPWESPWISPSVTRPVSRGGPLSPDVDAHMENEPEVNDSDEDEQQQQQQQQQESPGREKISSSGSEDGLRDEMTNGHVTHLTSKIETRSAPTTPRCEREQLLEFTDADTVS